MADDKKVPDGVNQLVETFLQCGTCKFYYDEEESEPRLLPCLHICCCACVDKISSGNKIIKCPKCFTSHDLKTYPISIFPKENFRHGLINFIKVTSSRSKIKCQKCKEPVSALYRCEDCSEFLCKGCYDDHLETSQLKSHSITLLENYNCSLKNVKDFIPNNMCQLHNFEKMNLYCKRRGCETPVCRVCVNTIHIHEKNCVCSIKNVYEKKKRELKCYDNDLEKKIKVTQTRIDTIDAEINNILKQSEQAKDEVRKSTEACMEALYNRANELHIEIDRIQHERTQLLQEHKEALANHKRLLEDANDLLQKYVSYCNATAMLEIAPVITRRLDYLNSLVHPNTLHPVSEKLHVSMTTADKDVREYIQNMGKVILKPVGSPNYDANAFEDISNSQHRNKNSKDTTGNIDKQPEKTSSTRNKESKMKLPICPEMDRKTKESCGMCGRTVTLSKNGLKLPCDHVFCPDCKEEVYRQASKCPLCGNAHKVLYGDQPDGTMKIYHFPQTRLPGYEDVGTIEVVYEFPPGIQKKCHPKPGKRYTGATKRGYLPDNTQGKLAARLLQEAFNRRLIFTIKEMKSTNQCYITWTTIYHKTRTHGGQKRHGYPDMVYLDRIISDLAYKGITEEILHNV